MLGFVTGQFNLFLANLKNFQNNFGTQLAAFITDPLKSLRGWLDGVYAGISAIAGEVTKGITSWWDSTSASVMSWIDTASASVTTWVNDQIGILQRGWDTTFATIPGLITNATADFSAWIDTGFKNIGAWWDDQVEILQRGWDTTFAQVPDLISGAVSGIKTWVEGFINTLIETVVGGFFNGVTKGIKEAGHSPLDTEKETDNVILKGLQTYMINYRNERDKTKVK